MSRSRYYSGPAWDRRSGSRGSILREGHDRELEQCTFLDGDIEHDDHVIRGGVWYHDRLDYTLARIAEHDAKYRHHRGRRRSFAKRSRERAAAEKAREAESRWCWETIMIPTVIEF